MFVTSLTIKKQESYEKDAGHLKGTIVLEGDDGKQEIVLSAKALSAILALIKDHVVERAKDNASKTKSGMDEAIHSPLLLEAASTEIIPF